MFKDKVIFIPGMYGMLGGSLYRHLTKRRFQIAYYRGVDFLNKECLKRFLRTNSIDFAFLCSSKVGGIEANLKFPVKFLQKNINAAQNLIECLFNAYCKDLVYFGSSCIFPKKSPQYMKSNYLLKSSLELTNEAYSLAKLIGIKICEYYAKQFKVNYSVVIPPSLFGRGDNFNLKYSHVIPSILKRLYASKLNHDNSFTV
jgi:GDP-L-fucose synthase